MTEPRQTNGGQIPHQAPSGFEGFGAFAEAASHHAAEPGRQCVELCPICRGTEILRASAPPELREQWRALQRDALATMRALIDHYLERLDAEPADAASRVEDIPIE